MSVNRAVSSMPMVSAPGLASPLKQTPAGEVSLPQRQDLSHEAIRVLIVDDEEIIGELLKDYLATATTTPGSSLAPSMSIPPGFYVETVTDGQAALERLLQTNFDIVLTDLKMPHVDGLELLKRLRDLGADTQVIMMTGYATIETAIEAIKMGAFEYIVKPFKPPEVSRLLQRAYEKLLMLRENCELQAALGLYELSEALSSKMSLTTQLEMLAALAAENFQADLVSLIIDETVKPDAEGHYVPAYVEKVRYISAQNKVLASKEPLPGSMVSEWPHPHFHQAATVALNASALSGVLGQAAVNIDQVMHDFEAGVPVIGHNEAIQRWLNLGFLVNQSLPLSSKCMYSFMSAPLKILGKPFGALSALIINDKGEAHEGDLKEKDMPHIKLGRRFTEGQRKGLAVLAGRAAAAIETTRMHEEMRKTFTQTIEGFARALEAKDPYTHGHSDRVAIYAKLIAEAMQLSEEEVDHIYHSGLLHDIGKIGIDLRDLHKPQKLTPEEYERFKMHPLQGRRIVEDIDFLAPLVPGIYHHHESWDGNGYPDRLQGEAIPLSARILAVADAYDAMTSDRPYRKALPHATALKEFAKYAGTQFDQHCVDVFCKVIEEYREQRRQAGLPYPL